MLVSMDYVSRTVDARTISRFACPVGRCFSYAPDRMYFRRQNGHLLDMVGVSSDYIVGFVLILGYLCRCGKLLGVTYAVTYSNRLDLS